jgi:hypothetical protein
MSARVDADALKRLMRERIDMSRLMTRCISDAFKRIEPSTPDAPSATHGCQVSPRLAQALNPSSTHAR